MRIANLNNGPFLDELKTTLILQKLNPAELKRFASICERRTYMEGERLVEQGSLGTELHILLEGRAAIMLRGSEGREVEVNDVEKGDVLGEAAIFTDLPRTASAVAICPCRVAIVPRDSLFAYCEENPKAGLKIFTFVIYSLLRRLGATSRGFAHEKESTVTREELERLMSAFPKSLEGILEDRRD